MRLNDTTETAKKSKFYVTRFKSYIYRLIFNSYLHNKTSNAESFLDSALLVLLRLLQAWEDVKKAFSAT